MSGTPSIEVTTPFFSAKLEPIPVSKQVYGMVAVVEITPREPITVLASVTPVPRNFSTRFMIPVCSIGASSQNGVLRMPFGENTQFDILLGGDKRVQLSPYGFEFFCGEAAIEPEKWLLNSGIFSIWE